MSDYHVIFLFCSLFVYLCMFFGFCLVCINVSSFVMYLWRGNEVGEFWHFIEDTVLKKKKKKRSTKELVAVSLVSAAFVTSF